VPDRLAPHWDPEFWSFHSPAWWRHLWTSSGVVDVQVADRLDGGWQDWLRWSELCLEVTDRDDVRGMVERELPMLRDDGATHLGFTQVGGPMPLRLRSRLDRERSRVGVPVPGQGRCLGYRRRLRLRPLGTRHAVPTPP
jgi:hypothetical protein